MLSVQFGLEPFRIGETELAPAFSSCLPTCTPCNIITVPVLSGGTSHYLGMWGDLNTKTAGQVGGW